MADPQKSRIILFVSIVTIAVSLIVIAGWILNIPVLQQIVPGFVSMVFNAAFCFILFAAALLLRQYLKNGYQNAVFFALSLGGTVIGLVTLLQFLFHFNTGLDELFMPDRQKITPDHLYPGRMAYNSAICFTLLGLGFLTLTVKRKPFDLIAQYLLHSVSILTIIALIGYLYGVSLFHSILYIGSMATHTAILFLILSVAASLINPSLGVTRLFTGNQVGNKMARRVFSVMLLMVIVFGSFRLQNQQFPLFSLDIWISLLAVGFLLLSLLLIWNTANWLNRMDIRRTQAEHEVKRINAELEKRVEERTAESKKNEEKYHSLIEQASDAIYILDSRMNFIDANASMCKMMAYSKDELLKMNVKEILDPQELKKDPLVNVLENPGKPVFRERTFRRKDGHLFPVEINVKVFPGRMIMVMARNITERKRIEAERMEAENIILKEKMLSDTIINSLPGPFYLISENGNQIRWNANYETVTGYNSDELPHLTSADIVAPEDHEKVNKAIERVFQDGYAIVEARIKAKDGTKTPFLLTGTPILYEGQRCLLGMGIDISARVKAEAELRASEQKYKLLFDSSPMPLWMIDKDTLRIIAANQAVADLYGYRRDELINMSVLNIRSDADREKQLAGYRRNATGEPIDMGIVRHLKKDGTSMYVHIIAHDIEFEGRPVRLSFTNDITERLKAEESLQKSEANLQTIFRTTNIVFTMLGKDLDILAFNPKASEFIKLHYQRDLEKGQSFKDYLSPERAPQVMGYLQKVLKGRTINYEVEIRGHWYYVHFAPVTSDIGEILGMLITLEEITERKKAEQDLKTAYSSIQNHINSIKGIAWKQSHLMRSPLANLKALADLLKSHPGDTESLAHFQTELDRLDAIIHEMAQDASDHVT